MSWLQLSYIHSSVLYIRFDLSSGTGYSVSIFFILFYYPPPLLLNLSFYYVVNNILLNKVLHSFAQGHFGEGSKIRRVFPRPALI